MAESSDYDTIMEFYRRYLYKEMRSSSFGDDGRLNIPGVRKVAYIFYNCCDTKPDFVSRTLFFFATNRLSDRKDVCLLLVDLFRWCSTGRRFNELLNEPMKTKYDEMTKKHFKEMNEVRAVFNNMIGGTRLFEMVEEQGEEEEYSYEYSTGEDANSPPSLSRPLPAEPEIARPSQPSAISGAGVGRSASADSATPLVVTPRPVRSIDHSEPLPPILSQREYKNGMKSFFYTMHNSKLCFRTWMSLVFTLFSLTVCLAVFSEWGASLTFLVTTIAVIGLMAGSLSVDGETGKLLKVFCAFVPVLMIAAAFSVAVPIILKSCDSKCKLAWTPKLDEV